MVSFLFLNSPAAQMKDFRTAANSFAARRVRFLATSRSDSAPQRAWVLSKGLIRQGPRRQSVQQRPKRPYPQGGTSPLPRSTGFMGPPGLKKVPFLFSPGESGDLLEDQGLTWAGFNARRSWFLLTKIALAHASPFPIQGGDAERAGQQTGAASHTGFRAMLHSLSVLFLAEAAGNASFGAGGLGTLLTFPHPGSATGKNGKNPLQRFSRWKTADVSATQGIELARQNTGEAHQAVFGVEKNFSSHASPKSRSFPGVGCPVFLSHPRAS